MEEIDAYQEIPNEHLVQIGQNREITLIGDVNAKTGSKVNDLGIENQIYTKYG